ncbi:MAG: ATP-binding protein [Deltaproteobacteria bacterium]|nr:ATP-binding protein [Deltaproteobacteria bacterium]
MTSNFLFKEMKLKEGLVRDLLRMNPWWQGSPLPQIPTTKRHLVGAIHRRLKMRLAPIVVVRGPRQIGKTTAQLHVLQDLLNQGISPKSIFRVQCDELPELTSLSEPILRLVDWYEDNVLEKKLNQAAQAGENTFLFFDEVQNLKDWAPQLKALVDSSTTQVVVTGSSALRIELGRDSLAGRISTIEAGVLSLTEIAMFHGIDLGPPFLHDNGLEPLTRPEFWSELSSHGKNKETPRDIAFKWFSDRGGYPLAHQKSDINWPQIADQLNETIIRRVIQHDLRIGDRGRKRDAQLLEELFRLACRYVGQTPGLTTLAREAHRALNANVGPQRVNHYLRFLGDTLLLNLVEPLEIRLKKKRGNPKICLADHGLRASWLQEQVPIAPDDLEKEPHLNVIAGHIAESVVGATLSTISGLDLAHLPERKGEPEIDFILTIGTKRIPLEVKYQKRIDALGDTEGLRTFLEKSINNAPFGLLVTQSEINVLLDPRIIALPLSTLMLLR